MEDYFSAHRMVIEDLYWKQNKTLQEVMETMENEHGFFARPKSYKSHFKRWGLIKNIKKDEVAAMFQIQQRRLLQEKKKTEFIRLGRLVDDKNLYRSAKRQHSKMDSTSLPPRAKTPPNIRYRTPDSPGPDRKVTIPFLAEDQMELEIQQLKADLFNARADLDKARADLDKARADLDKAREDIKSLEECLYQA